MSWNDFTTWFGSDGAEPILFASAVLFVAVIVSGLFSAWIARGAIRGLLARTDRQVKSTAITALVDAATEASVWNSLTPAEQVLSDRAVGQADTMVRLLPLRNAVLAADWSSHQLAELKRNSATFGYNMDPALAEFRDRLVAWQRKPGHAKRIFQGDLARWQFEHTSEEQQLIEQQEAWVAQQHHERHAEPAPTVAIAPQAAAAPAATAYAPSGDAAPAPVTYAPDPMHANTYSPSQGAQG